MTDSLHISFDAPATLRKWPSRSNERIESGTSYTVREGTLDSCVRDFMAKPQSSRHLYEIHTAPQPPVITGILSAHQIVEIARLRSYL
ncbi:hypothetical protein [Bradyrhizobium lablabi]|uniref:hypothetical protein n=1 Tax=Bradyrhizobium lablabi TaxID=722472 RepID=UPI001BA5715F|nr:hypothetical protein [Bradyrhizobium lablabi]MBR0695060.1 hypothetical protein [Bradyrhizobium lablabi]